MLLENKIMPIQLSSWDGSVVTKWGKEGAAAHPQSVCPGGTATPALLQHHSPSHTKSLLSVNSSLKDPEDRDRLSPPSRLLFLLGPY